MKRAVTVPPAARRGFLAGLKAESRHHAALPDPLPMGRVLCIVDRSVDTEEELKVLAARDDKGYFLDFYRVDSDRDGYTYWHGRIRDDGTYENLENFEAQWGRRIYPDDPAKTEAELQRILASNAHVDQVLRAKGFR
jgi:hypothetical protein